MTPIRTRQADSFDVGPLKAADTVKYLYAKLRAIGVIHPHHILPVTTCAALHKESRGWPGALDNLTMRAIERVDKFPIRREHIDLVAAQIPSVSNAKPSTVDQNIDLAMPKLLVTAYGSSTRKFAVKESIVLIGRARLNDLVVTDRCVSKFHALLIFSNNEIFMLDLKSANGIYINSHRVHSSILRHDDVIEIGNCRIKILHPLSDVDVANAETDPAVAPIIKTDADLRRAVAKKILRIAHSGRQKLN